VDLEVSAEDVAFRDEVRTWLHENDPGADDRPRGGPEMRVFDLAWQRKQFDAGWAGINWPTEYGGRGLSLLQQVIWYEEYAALGLPGIDACFVGNSHAGPTLISRSSDAQKSFHLPKILRGEVVWCQGFSEPNAGSDLASLSTRGVIDGDELVVTGQKLWTSFAHVSEYQELLVRTDPDVAKHKGITWVICDMRSPGVDVRPIPTMDGNGEFCEVFYDEVRIPISNVVGDINDGWSVAMSTLSFERGTAFTAYQTRTFKTIEHLIELARTRRGRSGQVLIDDDEIARDLATLRAESAALRAMTYAGVSRNLRTAEPGPEGSMIKLYWAELNQRVTRLAADMLGPDVLRLGLFDKFPNWHIDYLMGYSMTIGGGTSEIMRNIIGERVLGLPR
jgi:alkylation response protein AidB-like acyl-CoA dehydrogenase